MLTPEQLAHCADDIVELYSQLEEAIVQDVARRIVKTGTMTDTAIWQAQHMQELGTLNSDILSSISKYSGKCESELKKLFEDAAITATEYDNEIYRANGLNPKSIKVSDTQLQILEAGYKKTQGNLGNLTLTTAVSSQTSFINACSLAELKVTSGAFSPQQAIVDAIKQVAVNGAEVIYPSGHTDKLDVAVRRNVMTGIGQTTGQICLANARELGCDLMEITAHAGARPSHAAWQGQIVSLSGRKGYLSPSDIGYGSGAGFKGWNCRHDWYPYFEGSTRMYDEEKLKQMDAKSIEYPDGSKHTLYEAEQKQRAYERKIRESKRILAAYDESIKNAEDEATKQAYQNIFDKESVKLKKREAELNNFCNKTGLLKRSDRVQKYGFGRSTAQKAVQANKKAVAKNAKKSIIKERAMANGMRRSSNTKLTDEEKAHLLLEIDAIGADRTVFVFRDGYGTGYSDVRDKIFVSSNVFPSNDDSTHPRDLMSERAVLAHEYYGHRANRGTRVPQGAWNDEFRASYMAAKNCPNLSDEDRRYLILDALERAKEQGISIRHNNFIRRILYGY